MQTLRPHPTHTSNIYQEARSFVCTLRFGSSSSEFVKCRVYLNGRLSENMVMSLGEQGLAEHLLLWVSVCGTTIQKNLRGFRVPSKM